MKRLHLALVVLTMFVWITSAFSTPYTIDGKVDDWGIDLSASGASQMGYLDSHTPSGGLDMDYLTEDNAADHKNPNPPKADPYWYLVGPGWSYKNAFDVEAIYFDNSFYYAYIAIIQGMPHTGSSGYPHFDPGDIAINIGNGFEYGLGISDRNGMSKGHLYKVSDWYNVVYDQHNEANPWRIKAASEDLGLVDFVYSGSTSTHYILEAKIPLTWLSLQNAGPGTPERNIWIHWTQQCGNDYLNLKADVNPVPEPGTLLLLGLGLVGFAGYGRLRLKGRNVYSKPSI